MVKASLAIHLSTKVSSDTLVAGSNRVSVLVEVL